MDFMSYAPLARRTLKELPTFREHMIHMALGTAGEIGELLDAVKKVCVYGKVVDLVHLTEEVGDALWYPANMLPELGVPAEFADTALLRGCVAGRQIAQRNDDLWQELNAGEMLLTMNKSIAETCSLLPRLNPTEVQGSAYAYEIMEALLRTIGAAAGALGVSPPQAMARNIEKLQARYGEKYSDLAALNRNLDAERAALEGGREGDGMHAVEGGV